MKRAIAFGGGGPALGYDVGALARFADEGIEFDVWSLSCSGGWIGVIYNTLDGSPIEKAKGTRDHLRSVFRDSETYSYFPVAKIFTPEFGHLSPMTWPFWTNNVTGLTQLSGAWLSKIQFYNLYREDAPIIYHNAWNLAQKRIEMFSNKIVDDCGIMNARSVCACSSLPFFQSPVIVDTDPLCEAMMQPMNFDRVFEHQIDEIWIVHGLHIGLAKPPRNLTDSLSNLIMLLAATCGANCISLFRHQAQEVRWEGKIIELPTSDNITFDWTYENFDASYVAGYAAATQAIEKQ